MLFADFRSHRLGELLKEERWPGAPMDGHNDVAGLIELIWAYRPRTVLEIGSHLGVSTEAFLLHCASVTVVDPWADQSIYEKFMERCRPYPHLSIVRGFSPVALGQMRFGQFDMVYIDGAHDAVSVRADIEAAEPLVAPYGTLAGHDYGGDVRAVVLELLGEARVFPDTSWAVQP